MPRSVQADLAAHLTESYGVDAGKLYWDIFEQLRGELGYADYLGALERFRLERLLRSKGAADVKLARGLSFC
jgi:hypothetical protein